MVRDGLGGVHNSSWGRPCWGKEVANLCDVVCYLTYISLIITSVNVGLVAEVKFINKHYYVSLSYINTNIMSINIFF